MNTSEDKCSHGIIYDDPCIECEKFGLIEKIEWMKPIVEYAEKRLEEIEVIMNKRTPTYMHGCRAGR